MAFNSWAMVIKLLVTDVAANLALTINVALYNNNTAHSVVTQIQSIAGIIRKIKPDLSWPVCSQQKGYKTKKPITLPHSSFSLGLSCFACVCTCLSVLNPWGIRLHTLHLNYHWIIRRTLGLFWIKEFQIDRSVVDGHDGSILTPQCQLLISESTVLMAVRGILFIGT